MARFRKSIKISPGVKLNLSKSGVSGTFGVKGASVNVGKNGTYLNTGIPGTGVYDRKRIGEGSNQQNYSALTPEEIELIKNKRMIFLAFSIILSVLITVLFFLKHWITGSIFSFFFLICISRYFSLRKKINSANSEGMTTGG